MFNPPVSPMPQMMQPKFGEPCCPREPLECLGQSTRVKGLAGGAWNTGRDPAIRGQARGGSRPGERGGSSMPPPYPGQGRSLVYPMPTWVTQEPPLALDPLCTLDNGRDTAFQIDVGPFQGKYLPTAASRHSREPQHRLIGVPAACSKMRLVVSVSGNTGSACTSLGGSTARHTFRNTKPRRIASFRALLNSAWTWRPPAFGSLTPTCCCSVHGAACLFSKAVALEENSNNLDKRRKMFEASSETTPN